MNDTIAAVATARGAGGIAIVRMSGGRCEEILRQMFRPAKPRDLFESHRMMYGRVAGADGAAVDEVMAVLMRAPSSYTREDVAEIHCHGGGACAQAVLERAISLGARMAEPGEFTRRAFMNGRIDLSAAEAVMQLIGASSQAAARASMRQLEGGVSGFVRRVSGRLTGLMALIEASTDFPDEVEEEAAAGQLTEELRSIVSEIRGRCDRKSARLLREGASIVLAGRPNVGKSSLMNALLDQERAIVTDIPGTTRDVLTERVVIGGVTAELSDTAGQRNTDDPIERIGVERAKKATDGADVLLIVLDAAEEMEEQDAELIANADARAIICLNKSDLPSVICREEVEKMTGAVVREISAQTGAGIDGLIGEIARRISVGDEQDGRMTAERHLALAESAAARLDAAVKAIGDGLPLDTVAIDLREALSALSEITGENASEAVIDRVFSDFCVGK